MDKGLKMVLGLEVRPSMMASSSSRPASQHPQQPPTLGIPVPSSATASSSEISLTPSVESMGFGSHEPEQGRSGTEAEGAELRP
jgi:hypothetical protein